MNKRPVAVIVGCSGLCATGHMGRLQLALLALVIVFVWTLMVFNVAQNFAGKCQYQPLSADTQQITSEGAINITSRDQRQDLAAVERELWRIGDPKTETIHLVLVLCGKKKAMQARILAESVHLFSPGSPVHWHLVVDADALKELDQIGFLAVTRKHQSIYAMDKYLYLFNGTDDFLTMRYQQSKAWNKCKGLKVHLASIIPKTIDRVILIDVDTMVISPLERLYRHFNDGSQANPPPLFHMTVDLGAHYNRSARLQVHPFKVGLNSGVVLMHLDRMRNMSAHPVYVAEGLDRPEISGQYNRDVTDWGRLAFQMTKTQPEDVAFMLGDQDQFNAPVAKYHELASILPCGWNFQVVHGGAKWISHACNVSKVEIHLIHGNGNRFLRPISRIEKNIRGYYALYSGLRRFLVPESEQIIEEWAKEQEVVKDTPAQNA